MLVGLLSTASQLIALLSRVRIGCFTVLTVVCVVATRFLIHRGASVKGVDDVNAADDVPLMSLIRECRAAVARWADSRDRDHAFSLAHRRMPPMIPAALSTTEMSDGSLRRTFREFPPPMYK